MQKLVPLGQQSIIYVINGSSLQPQIVQWFVLFHFSPSIWFFGVQPTVIELIQQSTLQSIELKSAPKPGLITGCIVGYSLFG